ncbi:MAG: NAD(P)H-dependent oxidoreductase subunit E [Spirochaetota bacterium]
MTTQQPHTHVKTPQQDEEFPLEAWSTLDNVITELSQKEGALIPILQSAQQIFQYLPPSVIRYISNRLKLPYSEVAGVVSFYSYFSTVPRGKHIVRVCLGTACYVRGGKEVLSALEKELEISVGETTSDRLFTLEVGRCFGACGLAPVVMIGDTVHQRVKPSTIRQMLSEYSKEDTHE